MPSFALFVVEGSLILSSLLEDLEVDLAKCPVARELSEKHIV